MKSVPSWVSYSVYRVLLFAAPLAILLLLGLKGWIAAVIAALIGMSLSLILLRKPRENVARDLYAARHREKALVHEDAELEDAALDREESNAAPVDSAAGTEPDHGTHRDSSRS